MLSVLGGGRVRQFHFHGDNAPIRAFNNSIDFMVPIASAEMADGGEVRLGGNANAEHRKSLKQAAKDMGVPRSLKGPFGQSK